MRNTALTISAVSLLLLLPATPVLARGGVPPAPEEDGRAVPASAGPPAEPDAQEAFAHDDDQSIYVVQRRAYSKRGKLELTPIFFTSLNNKFVGHLGGAVAAAYHVRENLAVELTSSIPYGIFAYYSALVFEVYDYESLTPNAVDLKQMSYFGSLNLQYSALYGKFVLYGLLIDYDFFVASGFGLVSTLETCVPNRDGCSGDVGIGRGLRAPEATSDRLKLSGNLGGGMRFFFRDWVGLRIEIRDVVYADRATEPSDVSTDIRNNVLVLFGLTLLI